MVDHRECVMFAVIQTGGKQYRVEEGSVIRVEKMEVDEGTTIQLPDIFLVHGPKGVQIGNPIVSGAIVEAQIVKQMRDQKVLIFKKNRRHNYRRKKGHRQHLTVLKIIHITVS